MLLRNSVLFIGFLVVANTANARVASMSAVKSSVNSSGVSVSEVAVRCSTSKEPRTIIKQGKSTKWCDSEVASLCASQKLKAAKSVCASSYNQLLDEQLAKQSGAAPAKQVAAVKQGSVAKAKPITKSAAAEKTAVKKAPIKKPVAKQPIKASKKSESISAQTELLDIEQKRVQIRQRQLELRKLELELQKQRMADVESGF